MTKLIKKRFPRLFIACYLFLGISLVGFLLLPDIVLKASQVGPPNDFTVNSVGSITKGPNATNVPVMSFTLPTTNAGAASLAADV